MITGELKNRIDSLWTEFWTGGITNPLTVIEQITFLMYSRLLDMQERKDEKRAAIAGTRAVFAPRFGATEQDCRWETWRHFGAEQMLPHVRDKVFPHFRHLAERSTGQHSQFAAFMKDAQLMIQKPSLLVKAVNAVQALPLERGDTKGDLYEYLLSKLTTAGINGQFRTPRHIIRMMVELMQPKPTDRICDPSCGTAGFLIEAYDYLLRTHTSEAGRHVEVIDGEEQVTYSGDLLSEHRQHVDTDMFHAFDFDATMLRIATMNLVMHGVAEPDVHYQDTLSQSFEERHPRGSKNAFDLILANPPFKGSLDENDVAPDILRTVKTKKTELLFIGLILRMLKTGGRSATIVPDGVLFGSSKAHVQLRQHLVDNNQLEAVISLPGGVFKPYAGVSTAIIVFSKGGATGDVFFYDVTADGFSLDDKRQPTSDNDLPDVQAKWREWSARTGDFADRTQKAFAVPVADIRAQNYDLSINRYKEQNYEAETHEDPKVILARLKALECEILREINELEGLL